MYRKGGFNSVKKKTLLAKLKVAGHVSILATKKKKIIPGDAVTPNAGTGLLNC